MKESRLREHIRRMLREAEGDEKKEEPQAKQEPKPKKKKRVGGRVLSPSIGSGGLKKSIKDMKLRSAPDIVGKLGMKAVQDGTVAERVQKLLRQAVSVKAMGAAYGAPKLREDGNIQVTLTQAAADEGFTARDATYIIGLTLTAANDMGLLGRLDSNIRATKADGGVVIQID